MNPEQLWETTMNPSSRKLVQVTIEDAAEAERCVTILMGDKVEPRREYISEYANFNQRRRFRTPVGRRELRHGGKKKDDTIDRQRDQIVQKSMEDVMHDSHDALLRSTSSWSAPCPAWRTA